MTAAYQFWLDAYLFMFALVAVLFALVGVQRLVWWLADRPRRRVGEDPQEEYEDAAADDAIFARSAAAWSEFDLIGRGRGE